jgi:hypothetical protein
MATERCFSIVCLIILCGLFVTSCIFHSNLPTDWRPPESSPGNTCPDISGNFDTKGESRDNPTTSLVKELFGKDVNAKTPSLWKDATHVSIQQRGQGLIDIAVWKDNEVLYSKTLSMISGDYKCKDGWIKITSLEDVIVFGAAWTIRAFAKSDSYLLMRYADKAAGFYYVPIVISTVDWYRFAPVKDRGMKDSHAAGTADSEETENPNVPGSR